MTTYHCSLCGSTLTLCYAYGDPYFECGPCGAKYNAELVPGGIFSLPQKSREGGE